MQPGELDSAHEHNVHRLIEEFGEDKDIEVRNAYQGIRDELERGATVILYIPILAAQAARKTLRKKYFHQA